MVGKCQSIPTEYDYCQFDDKNIQEVSDFLTDTEYFIKEHGGGYHICKYVPGTTYAVLEAKVIFSGDYLVKNTKNSSSHLFPSVEILKDFNFNQKFIIKGD